MPSAFQYRKDAARLLACADRLEALAAITEYPVGSVIRWTRHGNATQHGSTVVLALRCDTHWRLLFDGVRLPSAELTSTLAEDEAVDVELATTWAPVSQRDRVAAAAETVSADA